MERNLVNILASLSLSPVRRYLVIRVRCDGELGVLIWRLIASDKRYIDLASVRQGRGGEGRGGYTTARHTGCLHNNNLQLTINYHNTQRTVNTALYLLISTVHCLYSSFSLNIVIRRPDRQMILLLIMFVLSRIRTSYQVYLARTE